jgi:hypothetical protein
MRIKAYDDIYGDSYFPEHRIAIVSYYKRADIKKRKSVFTEQK